MASIPHFKNENHGSLIKIEYAPNFAFTKFSQQTLNTISAAGIAFRPGYGWETMYCSEDTMGHQQDHTKNDNGSSWSQQVVGFVPGDELAIDQAYTGMVGLLFVLRITLPNGNIKVVGSPRYPLEFDLKSTTTTSYPGRSGTQLNFTAVSTARALFYLS